MTSPADSLQTRIAHTGNDGAGVADVDAGVRSSVDASDDRSS